MMRVLVAWRSRNIISYIIMIFNINSTRGQTRLLTCVARVTCLVSNYKLYRFNANESLVHINVMSKTDIIQVFIVLI